MHKWIFNDATKSILLHSVTKAFKCWSNKTFVHRLNTKFLNWLKYIEVQFSYIKGLRFLKIKLMFTEYSLSVLIIKCCTMQNFKLTYTCCSIYLSQTERICLSCVFQSLNLICLHVYDVSYIVTKTNVTWYNCISLFLSHETSCFSNN